MGDKMTLYDQSLQKRKQVEEFIGQSIPDQQWEAMVAWWDGIEGLDLERQQKLWKAAALAYEYQQRTTPVGKLKEALAHIEQIVKPFDISMSGESHFQRLEAPRVRQIWDIAREALNDSVDKEGLDPGDNEPMTYDES